MAVQVAPAIVFIDEVDAITQKRESSQRGMERRIVAQLLTCFDSLSLEQTLGKPVIVIGATNRPDTLDPGLRRAGRLEAFLCYHFNATSEEVFHLKRPPYSYHPFVIFLSQI